MTQKKSGLGRGLGALLDTSHITNSGSNYTNEEKVIDAGNTIELPIDQINANPNQPRKEFNQELLDELAQSIKSLGIIQPITVRKIKDGSYQVISGERRFRASKQIGLEKIPVFIREAEDHQILELALVENIQRENLNPLEIAISYKRLIEECEHSIEQVSEIVGKKRTTVTNYLRLLKLPIEIQFVLRDDKISMGHARAIINLPNEEDQLLIVNDILEKQLSVRQVEDIVRKIQNPTQTLSKPKAVIPYKYQKLNQEIKNKYHTTAEIQRGKNGKGVLKLHFSNDEILDTILEHLLK